MPYRIIISSSGSNCGKTTVACGLLSLYKSYGLKVIAYKTGPDYIDTEYLRQAGNCEAYNLDTWLMSPDRVRELFIRTSQDKDIAVIEGAMGLFDGGKNSTAEIAKLIHSPVIAVINVNSVGETAASIASGLRDYDRELNFAGVILNNAGSDTHIKLISEALERAGIKVFGALKRKDNISIPERRLGLLPVQENMNYDIASIRHFISHGIDTEALLRVSSVTDQHSYMPLSRPGAKYQVRIAVAKDEAFTFYYPESIDTLRAFGAEIKYFSPIHDDILPRADVYIFGGGFPEIYAHDLEANASMRECIRECAVSGAYILAECGGYMYLCDSLKDMTGKTYRMCGIIPASSIMTERPVIGYIEAEALSDNILCKRGESIRGHEFHYSRIEMNESPAFRMTRRRTGQSYTGGYAHGNILASYLHINFFGNEKLAERLLSRILVL